MLVSKEEEDKNSGGCVGVALLPNLVTLAVLHARPPQARPDSTGRAFVVLFRKDGHQRAPMVYRSSEMVRKRLSASPLDICAHIKKGLPSLPSPQAHQGAIPGPSPQPALAPDAPAATR